MSRTINYDMRCISPDTYELDLTMWASGKVFLDLYKRARAKLARSKGIVATGSPETIEAFDVTPQFFPFLTTILGGRVTDVKKNFEPDGIFILNHHVKACKFQRAPGEQWQIIVKLSGDWVRK